MSNNEASIFSVLLSEDVREEANGKISILGFWGPVCRILTAPPATLPTLAGQIYIFLSQEKPFELEVCLSLPGVPDFWEQTIELPLASEQARTQNILLKLQNVQIKEEGDIVLRAKVKNTTDAMEFRLKVTFAS